MSNKKKVNKKQDSQVESVDSMAEKATVMTDDGRIVTFLKDKTEVEIYKCRAKNVGRVMSFIAFVMKDLGIENFGDQPEGLNLTNPQVILPLLSNSADRIMYLSADLCSLEVDVVKDLELDDMIKLVTAQFEVNKDFFLKNVLPSARIDLKG